jgi:AcrR family transcriptional regulator
MAPRTAEQFEEIRGEKKALIMETALELFATKGYHGTSISMIAKDAGISKGLIYNYFESKEILLNSIIDHGFLQLKLMIDPNQDGKITTDELEAMIHKSFELVQTHPRFWTLYFSLLPQADVFELIEEKFRNIYKSLITMMTEFFKRKGVEDPEAEAIVLGSLLDGIFINFVFHGDNYPMDAVKRKLLERYCK